jgi:hypothetical protein
MCLPGRGFKRSKMAKIKYAIKRGDKYLTSNGGWTKDIYKAQLFYKNDRAVNINEYPKFYKTHKPVPIRETYLREEV